MIAWRHAKGRAVAPLFALTTYAMAWLVTASPLNAQSLTVSEADRAVAADWAGKVDDALESRDPGEAARLLLRAVRWDPSRWDDYHKGIELLASVDAEAAARHAIAELQGHARFTKDDAELLSRLATAALESEDDATWRGAAQLAEAAAEQKSKLGPEQALAAAQLWGEAGATYLAMGEAESASDAFEKLQRAASAEEGDRLHHSYRWDLVAACHIGVGEFDRAAAAIELLRENDGETARYFTLQSQLALKLDEPLPAIEHAERAVEQLAGPDDDSAEDAYAAFISAMHTANQPDRAAEHLVKLAKAEPDNHPLALAAIDARANAGRLERAWAASGDLIERLSAELPSAEGDLGADSSAELVKLEALAEAATRRLRIALRLGRVHEALSESVGWARRLGNLNPLWGELEELGQSDPFRAQATHWLDEREPDPKASTANNLAAATIACHVDRPAEAVAFLRAMFEYALTQGATADAIADEAAVWAVTFLNADEFASAEALLKGTIKLLEDEDGSAAIGELRSRLAVAIICQQAATGRADVARTEEALQLLRQAREQAPDDGYVAHQALFNALYAGRPEEVIALGEKVFERWPAPDDDSQFGSQRYHEVSEAFAAALLVRDEPGDADRAAELLEASLDHWPQSPLALTYLAWRDSRSPEGIGRALRLAAEAVERDPTAPDSRGFLGVVQLRAGEVEKGIESLRQALAMADEGLLSLWERDLFRHELAEALRANGRAEEAAVVESTTPAG